MKKEAIKTKEITEDEILEKKYRRVKASLQLFEKRKKGKIFLFTLLAFLLYTFLLYPSLKYSFRYWYPSDIALTVSFIIIVSCITSIIIYMIYEMFENSLRRKILVYESDNIQSEVEEDIFENSIKISYKYLDQYYLQTREQAQRGFFVTVCVSVFGSVLIFIGVAAMFFEKVEPSYITCASGVITEFIAAIFFYLYNKTVSSMSKYHNKLVLSQNISIALKVADSLPPEDKAKAKNQIITELLKNINNHLVKNDTSDESNE